MHNKLHRDIGLVGLTFVAVSGIIGSGWLFAPLLAVQHAGPAALIAWVIGGVAMLLLALTFAEISAMLPVPGGVARVPLFSHGNLVCTMMGWSGWIGYTTQAPIEVEAMLRYLAPHADWLYRSGPGSDLSLAGIGVAMGFLALFVVINAFGVKFFAYVNSAITWAKIAIPMVLVVTLLATRLEVSNFTDHGGFAPFGWAGVLSAVSSGGVIFSFIGFRHAVDMAGEVRNPGFNIPAALILSVFICFIIYGGLQFAFIGALEPSALVNGWGRLTLSSEFGPLGAVASALGLLWLVSLLNVGAVAGPMGGALVATGSCARIGFALAENGLFPKIIATLSARGVPLSALLMNLAIAVLTFVLLPFEEVVKLNESAIMLSFVVGPVAVVALRYILPGARRPITLPAVHVIACAAFVIATLIIHWSGWETVWRLGLCLILGGILFATYARKRITGTPDYREAAWLWPYFGGVGLISALGSFGGAGILQGGVDTLLMAVLSIGVFVHAISCRLTPEKFRIYMSDEIMLEHDIGGRGVTRIAQSTRHEH
ncbi:APC family permease [Aquabacter spiritensis]|uniref:Amino acid/polyamine/organocation transporter (APC superfamily) n=1 Tax=Aquabacter spiritensis TaxID=933073 RepID=A0A4R3LTJ0_9HYPH|nr:APC family permease [Aquabacter spiritensis]TCT03216.1 amino acid/polyamine/organocation transporter (APC superfamily) [Aquabacter spiritensis]